MLIDLLSTIGAAILGGGLLAAIVAVLQHRALRRRLPLEMRKLAAEAEIAEQEAAAAAEDEDVSGFNQILWGFRELQRQSRETIARLEREVESLLPLRAKMRELEDALHEEQRARKFEALECAKVRAALASLEARFLAGGGAAANGGGSK